MNFDIVPRFYLLCSFNWTMLVILLFQVFIYILLNNMSIQSLYTWIIIIYHTFTILCISSFTSPWNTSSHDIYNIYLNHDSHINHHPRNFPIDIHRCTNVKHLHLHVKKIYYQQKCITYSRYMSIKSYKYCFIQWATLDLEKLIYMSYPME